MLTTKTKTKKIVFISSTFIDLQEERKKVWNILEKFDVVVKGMENFGARTSNPLITCLSEVEQSDIYVGIIGMRYGSIDQKSGKSYSQLEYEKAIEHNKEILIYLIDEDNSAVKPSLIQFDKIIKLNNFKSILKDKHTVDSFSNAKDLTEKLLRKFQEFLTPKTTTIIPNDYENTNNILNKFFLVPAAYSGREIKLKVKFTGKPTPASKAICTNFNFEFGKTILNQIEVLEPELKFKNFRQIFIEFKLFNKFMAIDEHSTYEIFARLLFKDEKIKTLTTDFKDKIERVYSFDLGIEPEQYYPEEYYDVLKEGDGQVALELVELLDNKK